MSFREFLSLTLVLALLMTHLKYLKHFLYFCLDNYSKRQEVVKVLQTSMMKNYMSNFFIVQSQLLRIEVRKHILEKVRQSM